MTKQELDNLIIENINTNDAGLITGLVLQQVLLYLADYSGDLITSTDTESELTDENMLSSLRVLSEIAKNNEAFLEELKNQFLSKVTDDTASGLITFLQGIIAAALEVGGESLFRGLARVLEGVQFGESFAGGLAGFGGKINGAGYGELRGLTVWEYFKATEFIFNKVEINIGDKWNAPGRGKIKSVDTEQQFIELELEDGEIGAIDVDDICMGIFHSVNPEENATSDYDDGRGNRAYAGFFTSYFRIIQVMDSRKSKFRYELRPVSENYPVQYHPCALMKFTSYGNFTKKERQRSNYETLSYHRYLKDVRDWEFTINNIAAQRGDLSNLNVFGLNMEGYSEYINNVYFTGIIHQLSQQIQDELNKQQIGGKNLLREYDIRFGFKYWGGTGDFTEVDLDTLQNQPYMNVSPAEIMWIYPDNEANITIESNTSWTASTPNPWLSLSKTTGVGADSIILSSNTLFSGRLDRLGSVIITPTGLTNRTVQLTQKGRPEFVSIQPSIHSSEEGEVLTISGKTNSSKLTFSLGAGTIDISLPTTFIANGNITADNANVEGDPGATSEFNFSIAVTIPVNLMVQNISRNLIATTAGGQTGMCIITQGKARVVHELLSTPDSKLLVIGENIFINVKHN